MHKLILILPLFMSGLTAFAQPYTQPQYAVSVEKNITYGIAKNFAGNDYELKMDIYKPLNNNDVSRPIYVHVHGGAWLEISNKEQPEDAAVCMEMAKRGYVAANVEYRRGYHRYSFYEPYALCSSVVFPNQSDCVYVQDSSEIIRAIYRGMQDAKAAIRFMKGRFATDSTDVNTVCVGGESAGGFLAMYTGFLTCPDEKPVDCFALPDAKATDSDLADCNPAVISLARPDLGSIEGEVNLNGFDASVVGVANYFGGMMHPILPGPKPPALYLFHQTNDVVVDCNYKKPYQSLFEQVIYPLNLCQPLNTPPKAWGCCSINSMLGNMGAAAPEYEVQIVNNGGPNSLANPPGHAYDNIALRVSQAAALFSPYVSGQASAPAGTPCVVSENEPVTTGNALLVFPNPAFDQITIRVHSENAGPSIITISDMAGRVVLTEKWNLQQGENQVPVSVGTINPGSYLINMEKSSGENLVTRMVKMN